MDAIKIIALSFLLSGCYIVKSGYNQVSLLNHAVPIEEALNNPEISQPEKKKLLLAGRAREFAEQKLGLKKTKNYTKFVKLDRSHVSYVVSASPKWELKSHTWWFPIVGSVPYKGYFNEADAKEEAENLRQKNLDVYMRGVSAYSTLGWFKDPLLSSTLRYEDHDLVNTIIHETVHATLYIKSSADFNERMAVFLGNIGTELFYADDIETLKKIKAANDDDKLFSEFISKEIVNISNWYKEQKIQDEGLRQQRLKQIQSNYSKMIRPKLKGIYAKKFEDLELNNAHLVNYKTYMQDLSDFEKLFTLVGRDFSKFIEQCKKLENADKPELTLKALVSNTGQ